MIACWVLDVDVCCGIGAKWGLGSPSVLSVDAKRAFLVQSVEAVRECVVKTSWLDRKFGSFGMPS